MDYTFFPKSITRQQLDSAPLSFAQQRLWFLDQLNSESRVHNISVAIHFKGFLDVTALEQSLGEIVRHHEVLRTTFTSVDGQPLQVIAKDFPWKLSVVDLRELDETERQQESQRLISESVQQPFDLATGTLLRAVLQRLGEVEHILLLTIHEIVGDKWSLGLLLQELGTLYQAFSQGRPSPLVKLPIQYANFATWQCECLQNEVWASQQAYWKQQLEGELPVLELPTDHPRPLVQSYRGARQFLNLSQDLTDALKSLSRESGVTLFTTLLTAFKILLYRYTSLEDIIVGSKVANRNQAQFEGLIGLFANTLVMRTDLGGNPSFRELLGRVQDVVLSAYSHQDLPFEKLVEELQTERDLSRSPLFQVMFVLENEQETRLEFPGVSLNVVEVESKSAKFDLTVELQETSNGINGWFEYNADLFDADTIGRMIGHWEVLLAGVVAQPNQQISLLPILTEAERHQLLVEWNDTDVDYPKDKCIHQLFEEQVERTPDHVAVVFEDQQLTYRELNARANQLAHYLQKLGVGHEVLVGICLERSLELAIAILGILKAGGVCVPLDPTYPEERLAFMREDTQIRILLTIESLLEVTPKYIDHIVCLDTEWASIALEVRITPANTVTSDNLAFVFYTSGSTGKPKGVMITHIACCKNKLHDHATYQLEESDRILLKSSISFAAFLTEFFWPLLSGATVIMAEMGVEQDSFALVKLINKQKITVIGFSPSILQAFLEKNKIKSCKSIRYVFCNSETLPIELKNLFFSSLNANLQCIYGLTETGLATFWDCRPESNHRIIPIGRHTANTKIYILDSSHQPVPVGITGQLYIGGDGLARGYLNCLEITKEKFIPDCFFNQLSKRLFKTGDMARYLPDGNIEFLGRMDNQVKIRGFRVEPEEVEALLSQFSKIRQTIVMAREDIPGTKKLVAYVVPQSEHVPTSSELRRFLKQTLPDYMIPSIFVFLKTLPLTPNGKVDRRSLPIPDKNRPHLESTFVLPRTPLEQNILLIWSQVLKIEKIGIYDNFFDLGGHSLLATQILSRLKQTFNMDIPFKVIFEAQNIADLSEYIQTMNWFYSTPEKLMAVTQAYRKSGEI